MSGSPPGSARRPCTNTGKFVSSFCCRSDVPRESSITNSTSSLLSTVSGKDKDQVRRARPSLPPSGLPPPLPGPPPGPPSEWPPQEAAQATDASNSKGDDLKTHPPRRSPYP